MNTLPMDALTAVAKVEASGYEFDFIYYVFMRDGNCPRMDCPLYQVAYYGGLQAWDSDVFLPYPDKGTKNAYYPYFFKDDERMTPYGFQAYESMLRPLLKLEYPYLASRDLDSLFSALSYASSSYFSGVDELRSKNFPFNCFGHDEDWAEVEMTLDRLKAVFAKRLGFKVIDLRRGYESSYALILDDTSQPLF